MKVFSIYKSINKINGKIYIGFDSNWPSRQRCHKHDMLNGKYNTRFHNALRKYGWDSFDWEVICQSLDGEYLLNNMETYFINYYDSFNNGYNMTKGGDGALGHVVSDETKHKQSLAKQGRVSPLRGRVLSEEHRLKISKANKGNTNLKGYKFSDESKQRMSDAQKGRPKRKTEEHQHNIIKALNASPNLGKEYLLINPQGNEYKIQNLWRFIKNNPQYNLNYKALNNALIARKPYKKWQISSVSDNN